MPLSRKGFLEVPLVIFVFLSFAFGTYVVLTKPTPQIDTPSSNSSPLTNTNSSGNDSDQTDNSWWDAIADLFVYHEGSTETPISPSIINQTPTRKPISMYNPNETDANLNVTPTITPSGYQLPTGFLEPMHEPSVTPVINQIEVTSFTPINPDQFEDNSRFEYMIFDPNGGIISTEFTDGTKVYLVYPIDSFLIPTLVTLAPITRSPFSNYIPHNRFHGVSIGPLDSTYSPQRPAYLVFDLNKNRANISKPNTASACNYLFNNFNPTICAASKNIPLGYGVDAGKVVFGIDYNNEDQQLLYTYPIGDPDLIVAQIYRNGVYFYDEVDATLAKQLGEITLAQSSSSTNELTAVAQILASNQTSEKASTYMNRMQFSSSNTPRESLQAVNLANKLNLANTVRAKLNEYDHSLDSYSTMIRATGDQWADFPALAKVFNSQLNTTPFNTIKQYTPLPQIKDTRLFNGIKAVYSTQKLRNQNGENVYPDELAFAGLAEAEIYHGVPIALIMHTPWWLSLLQPQKVIAYTEIGIPEYDQESKECEDLIKKAFEVAGNDCDRNEILLLTRWALEERFDDDLAQRGFELNAACIKKDIDELETREDAVELWHEATATDEPELASDIFPLIDTLPPGNTDCDLVHKTLKNFGMNACN